MTAISPPTPAQPGQAYYLFFEFREFPAGPLVDPVTLTLDLTYGEEVGIAPDVAGPFTYSGATTDTINTIWRTGTGEYVFWWQVPTAGLLPGVYIANWSTSYGTSGDTFLTTENFPIVTGAPKSAAADRLTKLTTMALGTGVAQITPPTPEKRRGLSGLLRRA